MEWLTTGRGGAQISRAHKPKGTTMRFNVTIEVDNGTTSDWLASYLEQWAMCKVIAIEPESEFKLEGERVKRGGFPKATKPKEPSLYEQAKEVGAAWNASGKLSPCVEFDATRLRALKGRLSSAFFKQNWKAAIARLEASDFAVGKNDQQWKANVDWFLRPGNVERVMEGRYDNRGQQFDRAKADVLRTTLLSMRRDLERLRDDMKYSATDAQKAQAKALRVDIINIERKLGEMGEAV